MGHEKRIFLNVSETAFPAEIRISESDAHHLGTVLRCHPGEEITVADPRSGAEYSAKYKPLPAASVVIERLNPRSLTSTASLVNALIFPWSRGPIIDLVCEKGTELGARAFAFWDAPDKAIARIDRLQRITESAAKQSGKSWLPSISAFITLNEALQFAASLSNADRKLYCSLEPGCPGVLDLPATGTAASVAIGPPEDFSQEELQCLKLAGFIPVSLGSYRLRSETAALAALALLQSGRRKQNDRA